MKIHREGYVSLAIVLIVSAAIIWVARSFSSNNYVLIFAYALASFLFLIILQFFRNPIIRIKKSESTILAPADGKVVVIEEVEETEYFKDKRLQVSVFMSPINVHVNRNPIGGLVTYAKYHPGLYLVAWHPKSSTENERTTFVIQHQNGTEILFRQIAGALARRIKWYIKEGQMVEQGSEMGFIKFGSRVDLFFPIDTKLNVKLGQVVKGGRTVLAEI